MFSLFCCLWPASPSYIKKMKCSFVQRFLTGGVMYRFTQPNLANFYNIVYILLVLIIAGGKGTVAGRTCGFLSYFDRLIILY